MWKEQKKLEESLSLSMAENPHNSQRKNVLIKGRHILIYIYEGLDEVRGKINGKPLKKG